MEELTIAESKTLLALKSLNINKSPCPDEIGTRLLLLLVELSKSICHPLRKIIYMDFQKAFDIVPNKRLKNQLDS